MKKPQNKTDDLLKRLGASLRDSPLNAHARTQSDGVKNDERNIDNTIRSEPAFTVTARSNIVDITRENQKTTIAAAQMVVSSAAMQRLSQGREELSKRGEGSTPQKILDKSSITPNTSVVVAEDLLSSQVGGKEETPQRLEVPMSEKQMEQWKEMQMMKEAIAELKTMQKDAKVLPVQIQAKGPTPAIPQSQWNNAPATNYAGGSFRPTASGWKTSTVGLYPEDYDKAYEVMNYLRAQTGQAVNLSRVIKIALRLLEVNPQVLEVNAQIRSKDGRLLSRRG